jgi:DNA-binding NtrC family response regulator
VGCTVPAGDLPYARGSRGDSFPTKVLVAHGDERDRRLYADALAGAGCVVLQAADEASAERLLAEEEGLAMVLVDFDAAGPAGVQLLAHAHQRRPNARRVMCVEKVTDDTQRLSQALRAWLLSKPVPTEALRALAKSVSTATVAAHTK